MEIQINQIPNSKIILIPVASQNISGLAIDVNIITCKNKYYKVLSAFSYKKGELYPGDLMLIAIGKEVSEESIWRSYPKSDKIYIFICKETEKPKEEKKKKKKKKVTSAKLFD